MRFPATVLLLLSLTPPTEAQRIVIPVVGSVDGASGANFRTELSLVNRMNVDTFGHLQFRKVEDEKGLIEGRSFPFRLGPYASITYPDVVAAFGAVGLGTLEVVVTEGGVPAIHTRVFEDRGGEGSYGTSVRPLPRDSVVREGERAWLVVPSDLTDFRANVGVRTLVEGVTFQVRTYGSSGRSVRTTSGSVGHERLEQVPAAIFAGGELMGGELLEIEVTGGSAFFYLSTIDNRTNDSSIDLALTEPGLHPVTVPIAGSVRGAFGSIYRTQLRLGNPTDEQMTVVLSFVDQEGDAEPAGTWELPARTAVVIEDPGSREGVSGIGSLLVEPETGPAPLTQASVSDLSTGGTYGVAIPALSHEEATGPGESALLAVPADLQSFRMNLGYRVVTAPITFEVDVFDSEGHPIRETLIVTESEPVLRQSDSSQFIGETIPPGGAIRFRVSEGAAHFYAAVNDNRTNDPSLQLETIITDPPRLVSESGLDMLVAANGTTPRRVVLLDGDGDWLHLYEERGPKHGELSIEPLGDGVFDLDFRVGDYEGTDSLVLVAEDSRGGWTRIPVAIEVERTGNSEPQAIDSFAALQENTSLQITLRGVDAENGQLEFEIVEFPLRGALGEIERIDHGSVRVRYTPETNYHGKDRMKFRVTDPGGRSDVGIVEVEVAQTGDLPAG